MAEPSMNLTYRLLLNTTNIHKKQVINMTTNKGSKILPQTPMSQTACKSGIRKLSSQTRLPGSHRGHHTEM